MSWFNFNPYDFAFAFLSVLFEGIPFLLLGSLISGFIDVYISSERMAKWLPKNSAPAILMSGLLGLVLPMCECGSVIVIRRFIRKGLPLSCAVTYMLSSPIVSPIVALSTFAAFKGQDPWTMTLLRLGLGYMIAVGVGLIVQRFRAEQILTPRMAGELAGQRTGFRVAATPVTAENDSADAAMGRPVTQGRKLILALQSATSDFLDVSTFLIIGVAITSVFNTAINQAVIEPVATQPLTAIATLMGLAALLAICSTSDAFIAATFATFPFAAKLAFLLFGPVFDLKLIWLYGLVFRRRFVLLLSLGLFLAIGLICWRLHGTLERPPVNQNLSATTEHAILPTP